VKARNQYAVLQFFRFIILQPVRAALQACQSEGIDSQSSFLHISDPSWTNVSFLPPWSRTAKKDLLSYLRSDAHRCAGIP